MRISSSFWGHSHNLGRPVLAAAQWIKNLRSQNVPVNLFTVRYDRASGPGGQHVNKVSSKCTLMLPTFSTCDWFPKEIRDRIVNGTPRFRYYNRKSDTLVVQSDSSRSREKNRTLCLHRLVAALQDFCVFPEETTPDKRLKWHNIRQHADCIRIKNKRKNSELKKSRNKNFEW